MQEKTVCSIAKCFPAERTVFFICPWCGTRKIRTIVKLFSFGSNQIFNIYTIINSYYYIQIKSGLSLDEFLSRCRSLSIDLDDPNMVLLPQVEAPKIDKYDSMIPETLLRSAFFHNQMDVASAIKILKEIGTA